MQPKQTLNHPQSPSPPLTFIADLCIHKSYMGTFGFYGPHTRTPQSYELWITECDWHRCRLEFIHLHMPNSADTTESVCLLCAHVSFASGVILRCDIIFAVQDMSKASTWRIHLFARQPHSSSSRFYDVLRTIETKQNTSRNSVERHKNGDHLVVATFFGPLYYFSFIILFCVIHKNEGNFSSPEKKKLDINDIVHMMWHTRLWCQNAIVLLR